MKQGLGVLLLLLLTAVGIWFVVFQSTHDSISDVRDVSQFRLRKGRLVNLIGIAPTAVYKYVPAAEAASYGDEEAVETGQDSVRVRVEYDKESVSQIVQYLDQVGGSVKLEFSKEFEPDSASMDLTAYLRVRDGTDLGAWILSHGLARVNPRHHHPRAEKYKLLESEARRLKIEIWSRETEADSLNQGDNSSNAP